VHAPRDLALQQAPRRVGGLPQQRQLAAKLVKQTSGEAARRGVISGTYVCRAATRFDDQINRTVLQVKPPAISQKPD
jgi:hypothetical protein